MLKRIATIHGWHDQEVTDTIDQLQRNGFEVTKVERESKMWLIVFGTDVTNIYYRKQGSNDLNESKI